MIETNPKNPTAGAPKGTPGEPPAVEIHGEIGFDFASFSVAIFVVALLFTGAVFGYRYLILERTLTEQRQQMSQLESELAEPKLAALEKQIQEIAGGIDKIRPILDEKIRYAELFWTLRKTTEKGVRWTSLGFNESKELSLVGEAVGWGQVARQLAMLKQDQHFTSVELTSAALQQETGGSRVAFSLNTKVATDKLVPPP